MQVGCTLIEMQPEQFSRKGKSAERNGKTDYHIIADMASAMLCNGSVECLIPPLRRGLCNYFSTAHGATAFQECEPLRMLSAMGFRQNSGATMRCKQGAGGLPEADCCALTSSGKWWRLRNDENIPIECDVLTDCLTPTTAAA